MYQNSRKFKRNLLLESLIKDQKQRKAVSSYLENSSTLKEINTKCLTTKQMSNVHIISYHKKVKKNACIPN